MDFSKNFTCTFIGLGLIGGSIAKAIRKHYPHATLYAYNRHLENVKDAITDQTLNGITNDLLEFVEISDIIFLCAPVGVNIKNLEIIKPFLSSKTLLTDVGSVKGDIHKTIEELNLTNQFIGAHPMCGSEKTGYCNAKVNLLENSYYILTPTNDVPEEWTKAYFDFVKKLGAIPIVTNPQKHDYSTAAISHVPHLIAGELVRLVMEHDSDDEFMKTIAAGGFKDITRIASSSPEMWQHICQSNPDNIIELLENYIENLSKITESLKNKDFDKVGELFETVGPYRTSMNDLSGNAVDKVFQLYLNIPNKAGAIAQVANQLATHDINIKNIGITHNREHQDGVLYIVFYDFDSMEKAKKILF